MLPRAILITFLASGWSCASPPPAKAQATAYSGPPGQYHEPPASNGPPGTEGAPAAGDRMAAFERGVFESVNHLRTNPAGVADELARHRRHYRGRYLYLPGVGAPIRTYEGAAAVDEAIEAARAARAMPWLRLSPGLSAAARAHAEEIGEAGTMDHKGRDRREPFERMMRHGRVRGLTAENIGAGWGGPRSMVLSLFIDDGIVDRGHRLNLLEPEYRFIGVGCARHKIYNMVCVLDLAAEFRDAD